MRSLPAVDAVLRVSATEALVSRYGRAGVTAAVREALRRAREEILNGGEPAVSEEGVLAIAARILSGRGIRRVVNATGVVLHTNLGRSVLSERAVEAVLTTATSYSNLE
ncbi:MAG: L-seryl-tRNA(Sec) selenium transferase, partial [Actinomycetota bacterium]|nr:L-seryl-tRNA(Sec) selenium transferase [Actinomycetota bacterium]